ncbi:MAG: diaminopimelate epimerase, partial [Burkholderiales bacterium]
DFIVFDARKHPVTLSIKEIKTISDRHYGIGCDQLVIMQPSKQADVYMHIINGDGSVTATCGNVTRCVAALLLEEQPSLQKVAIETLAGVINAYKEASGLITAEMVEPKLTWQDIPLSQAEDTLHVRLTLGELTDPVAVSMGNPHIIFFVPEVTRINLAQIGLEIEHHPLFPERVNVSIARIVDRETIHLRVWERSSGETLACGSAACATLVAAVRRGLCNETAKIILPGGELIISWQTGSKVKMTGEAVKLFEGNWFLGNA